MSSLSLQEQTKSNSRKAHTGIRRFSLLFFVLWLGVLFLQSPAHSAPEWFIERDGRVYGATAQEAATAYLSEHKIRLGIQKWELGRSSTLQWRDHKIIRFRVEDETIPVFGAEIRVVVTSKGSIRAAVIDVPKKWKALTHSPAITEKEAFELVEDYWRQRTGSVYLGEAVAELGFRRWGGSAVLCYRILAPVGVRGYLHYIDAERGRMLSAQSAVFENLGRVYGENPVATPDTTDATMYNLDDGVGPDNVLEGWDGKLHSYTHVSGTVQEWDQIEYEHLALGDGDGNFLYDATEIHPSFGEPFTEVNLYYHLDRSFDYFLNTHELELDRSVVALAKYTEDGNPFENAFFTPVTPAIVVIALGQGAEVDYGYDGDVILHEFGHYVVDTVAGLGYMDSYFDEWGRSQMPGGLHEGYADYWAGTMTDDSLMGEYALGAQARDMVNSLSCPDDMWGEPHIDGEVAGGAAWEVRETAGAENADQLIYGALTVLTPNATYKDFADGIILFSQTLVDDGVMTQTEADDVQAALENRGLTKCGRYLDFSEHDQPKFKMIGFDMLATQMGTTCSQIRQYFPYYFPGPFQFRFTTPDSVEGLQYIIDLKQTGLSMGDDYIYKIYIRKDEMVHYRMETVFGGFMDISIPETFDFETEDITEKDTQLVLSPETTPELLPNTQYYFAIGSRSCPTTEATFELTVDDYTPPEPDAGVQEDAMVEVDAADATPDTGPDNRGCSCEVPAGSSRNLPFSLIVLFGLGLFIWRKRKR